MQRRSLPITSTSLALALLVAGCGSEPAPGAPDAEPLAPIQMIDRANDVAEQAEDRYDQVEERYEQLDQP